MRSQLHTIPDAVEGDLDTVVAALKIASAKWDGPLILSGDRKFLRAATEAAVDLGITIANPDMQQYQRRLKSQRIQRQMTTAFTSAGKSASQRHIEQAQDISR